MQKYMLLCTILLAALIVIFGLYRYLNGTQNPTQSLDTASTQKASPSVSTPYTFNNKIEPSPQSKPRIIEHRQTTHMQTPEITEDTIDAIPAANITTYNDLITHLQGQSIDLDSVVDFVNQSSDGFEYVVSQYLTSRDLSYKSTLLKILDNSENPKRSELAVELAYSDNKIERETAYRWLSISPNINHPEIYNVLINAMYQETDAQLLSSMLSTLPIPDANTDPVAYEYALSRVHDLAQFDDPEVASYAITKAAEISQDQPTLQMLLYHAQSSDQTRQIAAIEGLRNFETLENNTLQQLNTLLNNPSVNQAVRERALSIILDYENKKSRSTAQ